MLGHWSLWIFLFSLNWASWICLFILPNLGCAQELFLQILLAQTFFCEDLNVRSSVMSRASVHFPSPSNFFLCLDGEHLLVCLYWFTGSFLGCPYSIIGNFQTFLLYFQKLKFPFGSLIYFVYLCEDFLSFHLFQRCSSLAPQVFLLGRNVLHQSFLLQTASRATAVAVTPVPGWLEGWDTGDWHARHPFPTSWTRTEDFSRTPGLYNSHF